MITALSLLLLAVASACVVIASTALCVVVVKVAEAHDRRRAIRESSQQ